MAVDISQQDAQAGSDEVPLVIKMTRARSAARLKVDDPTDMQAYRLARGMACAAAVKAGAPEGYVALADWYALGGDSAAPDDAVLAQGYELARKFYAEAVADGDTQGTSLFGMARLWGPVRVDGALANYFDVVHVGADGEEDLSGLAGAIMANAPTAEGVAWMTRAAAGATPGAAAWLADLAGYRGLVPPGMDARASAMLPDLPDLPELDTGLPRAIAGAGAAAWGAGARRWLVDPLATEARRGEARALLGRAADGGDVLSMLLVADGLLRAARAGGAGGAGGGDPARAVALLEHVVAMQGATPLNHEWAATRLMECCRDGVGVPADAARAMHWRREAARLGGVGAMAALGATCMDDNGPIPRDEALEWLHRAADAGDADSMARLGLCQVVGRRGDARQGEALVQQAAGAGSVLAMVMLGDLYATKDVASGAVRGESPLAVDMGQADHYYAMAADRGDVGAMVRHARCLRDGTGVARDPAAALGWYRAAAAQGDIEAMLGAGQLCCDPAAGVTDPAEGVRLLQHVAWGTDAHARVAAHALIALHAHDANPAERHRWEDQAIALGDLQVALDAARRIFDDPAADATMRARGVDLLDRVTADGSGATPAQQGEAFNLQVAYCAQGHGADPAREAASRLRAAELGNADAMAWMGEAYFIRDRGVVPDEALEWLRRSAAAKNPISMANLGFCEIIGMAGQVSRDIRGGLMLLDEAAKLDSGYAKRLVGDLHATKNVAIGAVRGTSQLAVDLDLAAAAYATAAARGDVVAMVRHADCLRAGTGCEADMAAALQWYQKAADAGDVEGMLGAGRICCDPASGVADRDRGIALFTQAARGGDANALAATHELIGLHYNDTDPSALRQWEDRAVTLGDMRVALDAARRILHADGGVEATAAERAVMLLRKVTAQDSGADAAQRGEASDLLADCLVDGTGIAADAAAALSCRRVAAELGNDDAMEWLANDYFFRDMGVAPDEALEWLRRSAAAKNPRSMAGLGFCLVIGVGGAVAADVPAGQALLREAINLQCGEAAWMLADLYAHRDVRVETISGTSPLAVNMEQAAPLYSKAAGLGEVIGMARYADCLSRGEGVAQNTADALLWYQKAAEAGYVPGMLGVARLCGDQATALTWYERASDDGNLWAMLGAGQIYCDPASVRPDRDRGIALLAQVARGNGAVALSAARALIKAHPFDKAPAERHRWEDRAVALGDMQVALGVAKRIINGPSPSAAGGARAASLLGQITRTQAQGVSDASRAEAFDLLADCADRGIGIAADPGMVVEYRRKAAELGNDYALWWMGNCYLNPARGVAADEALDWLTKASTAKKTSSMAELGWCYMVGPRKDLKADPRTGERLLREAVKLGSSYAMRILGDLYAYRENSLGELTGTSPLAVDPGAAAEFYLMGAQKGDQWSMVRYARAAEGGMGIEKDLGLALHWHEKAAQAGVVSSMMDAARLSGDETAALKWYGMAGRAGNVTGMMEAARLSTDAANALYWHEKAATYGNVEAMVRAGQAYAALWRAQPDDGGANRDGANRQKALTWLARGAQGADGYAPVAVRALVALHRHDADPAALERWKARALELGDMDVAYETATDILHAATPDATAAAHAVELLHRVTAQDSGVPHETRGAAALLLAQCYAHGTGCAADGERARTYYQMAAQHGSTTAIRWMAQDTTCHSFDGIAPVRGLDRQGLYWMEQAAATDDPDMMCRLGFCYVIGVDSVVKADVKAGLRLLEAALDLGHDQAGRILGDLYGTEYNRMGHVAGRSVLAVDMAQAAHYYQIGAQMGDGVAMLRYADCLRDGNGVTRDVHAALALYLDLAGRGEVAGMLRAGQLYATDDTVANRERAITSFGNAVKANNSTLAMCRLGEIYAAAQDWPHALQWLEKSAAGGFAEAIVHLAGISLRTDVPGAPDRAKAIERLKLAVRDGFVPAKRMLGCQLIIGANIARDLDAGVRLLGDPGVADGDVDACYWLGRAEYDRKNLSEAARWYIRAMELGSYSARGSLLLVRLAEPGLVPASRCLAFLGTPENINILVRFGGLTTPLRAIGDFYKQLAVEKYTAGPSDIAAMQGDFVRASEFYALADKAGEDPSLYLRAYVALGAGSSQGGVLRQGAIQQYEKIAADGDVAAMKVLSCLHSAHPQNPCADPDRMFLWTKRAADKGDAWAMLRLAYCHCLGIGVSQNYKTALKIFEYLAKEKVGWGLFGEGMYYLYQDSSLFFNNYDGGIRLLHDAHALVPSGGAAQLVAYNCEMMATSLENARKSKSERRFVAPLAGVESQIDIPNPEYCVPRIFALLGMHVNALTLVDILPCSREWMATRMGQDVQTCFNGVVLPSTKILKAMS
ncbi:hypothetical protein [Novacetimonas hansenii]|uniref:hypothetical protein n=1 Tax=Novacetimonas hansenii TaxID=436 RepID=UPI0039E8A961